MRKNNPDLSPAGITDACHTSFVSLEQTKIKEQIYPLMGIARSSLEECKSPLPHTNPKTKEIGDVKKAYMWYNCTASLFSYSCAKVCFNVGSASSSRGYVKPSSQTCAPPGNLGSRCPCAQAGNLLVPLTPAFILAPRSCKVLRFQ